MILLIKLFLAHIIGDFFLQSKQMVNDKEAKKWSSPYLYLHILLHFVLIIAFVGSFSFWLPALLIAFSHGVIDLSKLIFQTDQTKRNWFFIDQGLHLMVLFAVWAYADEMESIDLWFSGTNVLVLITAILTLLTPASLVIRTVIAKWPPEKPQGESQESLQDAGKLIGYLERLLIFTFVVLGKWEGVGFLLAAKSIFRFGDLKDARDMKLTEYVLIGTLLSAGIAILVGMLAGGLLQH